MVHEQKNKNIRESREHVLLAPRFQSANAKTPGNRDFWAAMLDQSDNFSFKTARDGKGGPFGAQLWLVNPVAAEYVLVGTPDHPEDSNAVVSKGLASAHAEAENLSPDNRQRVTDFLENRKGKGWQIVQISSGESCQSCRTKQALFANELIERGLIDAGGFNVVFKATYQQTKRDADFNDAPYDMAFRAIQHLGIFDDKNGLFAFEGKLLSDSVAADLIKNGELIYNAVSLKNKDCLSMQIQEIFKKAGEQPVAVIVSKDRQEILAAGFDQRSSEDSINLIEKTAIVSALHQAAEKKHASGIFEAWNLENAELLTNIKDIGPLAYAETLWYNLSGIAVIDDYAGDAIEIMARELPCKTNSSLFKEVAAEYNSPASPISVEFFGDIKDANIAHSYWMIHLAREKMLVQQAMRMENIKDTKVSFIDGTQISLPQLVETSSHSSHYNGKKALTKPGQIYKPGAGKLK